ncbi:Cof-type HAD-IIB family hydrolase [Gloeocapsa sp. PCC 73106]|uniref:Cof-type HAD-IIB family hydrolase n=1 Tax=Gloeocapsa sp. PCC 73106 TaxID=102232 RepID=UPI0002ACE0CB|nr:Cof-type HAD-IIB family hydrolase [Gloeocapsa sp. PCC 73106]ELR99710.1 HAD-superfamily hydrolase, subfamily IIB [Gloeocapsa sp. PCC 73106]
MSIPDIKLLVLDIDGTIAGSSNQITPVVKSAIQRVQQQNIQVTLATGRMYRSALPFYYDINSNLPLLAYNGAWIQNPRTQQMHQHLPVSVKIALELLEYFESPLLTPYFGFHVYLEDQLYVKELTPATKEYAERSQVEAIAVGDLRGLLNSPPTKLLAIAHQPNQIMKKLIPDLRQRYSVEELYLTQSAHNLFEAIHPRVNKGKAVEYLAETLLGISREQVMVIGDNFNDIEMLDYGGWSIAMGNAPPEVKKIADWVAPSVEEDGVAVAIDKFF